MLEQAITEKAAKLGNFQPAITQLHVAVTSETRHSSTARVYKVRLDVHVKGKDTRSLVTPMRTHPSRHATLSTRRAGSLTRTSIRVVVL